jgi:enoyl-CoA hydratase
MSAVPDNGTVRVERPDADLAVLVLDRPAKLNALTPEMLAELDAHLAAIDSDETVRAVVLQSAGDRVFCAGADIRRFKALTSTQMWRSWTRLGHGVFDRLSRLRQPTVVAVDGGAFGGGLELALACDVRVLADDAVVGLTEVGLGTVPGWGGTARLAHTVGVTRAKEMLFTGAPIDAATALAWGLVNRVVPRADVVGEATALARVVAAQAPVAVQMVKQAVDVAAGTHSAAGAALESLAAAASGATDDFAEGLDAFTERRPARFTGR